MNKAELVELIQKELGKETSKAEAERALNAVLESIKSGIKKTKKYSLLALEHSKQQSVMHVWA